MKLTKNETIILAAKICCVDVCSYEMIAMPQIPNHPLLPNVVTQDHIEMVDGTGQGSNEMNKVKLSLYIS